MEIGQSNNFSFDRVKFLPVASDNFEVTIVSAQWNVEPNDSLAGFDEVQPLGVNGSLWGAGGEEKLNLLEEARLTISIELRSSNFWCFGNSSWEGSLEGFIKIKRQIDLRVRFLGLKDCCKRNIGRILVKNINQIGSYLDLRQVSERLPKIFWVY